MIQHNDHDRIAIIGVLLFCDDDDDLSQIVIFAVARHQQHGVGGLRLSL